MDKIDYIMLKLQYCNYEHGYRDIYQIREENSKKEERYKNINEFLNVLSKQYSVSLEDLKNDFEKKYNKDFNAQNIIETMFDKLYMNKKYAYFLEIKNLIGKNKIKNPTEKDFEEYKKIIDKFASDIIHDQHDTSYRINIPLRYLNIDDMEYLSQFKILSRAGIFITRSETMVELLQFNKFEEFNYMNSKFLDLDEEDVARIMYFMSYYLTENNKDIGDYLSNFTKTCKDKTPYFFDIIKELNTYKKDVVEKIYKGTKKFTTYSNPIFSEKNLKQTQSLINMYSIMEENKELQESLLNTENAELKKKRRI